MWLDGYNRDLGQAGLGAAIYRFALVAAAHNKFPVRRPITIIEMTAFLICIRSSNYLMNCSRSVWLRGIGHKLTLRPIGILPYGVGDPIQTQ